MSPIIEAAWIAASSGFLGAVVGVTSALIVARIGFRATRETAAATIAANSVDIQAQLAAGSNDIKAQIEATSADLRVQLDAARRDRVWEKQAATYVEAITAVRWSQARRQRQLDTLTGETLPDEKPPVDWTELEARLFAFASVDVLVALQAAGAAGLKARRLYNTWAGMADDEKRNNELRGAGIAAPPARPAQALIVAAEAVRPAVGLLMTWTTRS